MSIKPQKKVKIGIANFNEREGWIGAQTDEEGWEAVKEFAALVIRTGDSGTIYVDSRYDFLEVLRHLREWEPTPLTVWEEGLPDTQDLG